MKLQLTPNIPKVMKNDIRRHYSRMFMNTVNSADFANMQNYFNTFMAGPCKFIADHITHPDFAIPDRMIADGPRLMAHYLLGCFIMYPDMTLTMRDTRIVTSSSWVGTKIVMEMEIHSTKMYDLDLDAWVPQISTLEACYEAAQRENALPKALSDAKIDLITDLTSVNETAVRAVGPGGQEKGTGVPPLCREVSDKSASQAMTSLSSGSGSLEDKIIQLALPRVDPATCGTVHEQVVLGVSAPPAVAVTTPPTPRRSKGKRGGRKGTATAAVSAQVGQGKRKVDELGNPACITSNDAECTSRAAPSHQHSHIPEAFVQTLFARAKLLPVPKELFLLGEITMFLDENNHIQHMNLAMVQKNV